MSVIMTIHINSDRDITYLTQDEMRRLFALIKGKRDKTLFQLAYHHGLRKILLGSPYLLL